MKLTCTQENLTRALSLVGNITQTRTNLPILNNVLLQADKEGLTLITTNLEIAIKTTTRAKVENRGSFTVQAKLLTDFIGSLSKENIDIKVENSTLSLNGENHNSQIRGLDATDFPVIPDIEEGHTFSIATNDFRNALRQVIYAASNEESRPELNGVYWHIEGKQLTLVATDSYRLAEKKLAIINTEVDGYDIIVPAKTMFELEKIVTIEAPEKVSIKMDDHQVQFEVGSTTLTSRLVAGKYPDYKQIIPRQYSSEINFQINEMSQAIKSTALFCKQGINDVRISVGKNDKEITIRAENSTAGKNKSLVTPLSKEKETDIVFNYKYLLDGLRTLNEDVAFLKTNDASSPALLIPSKDESFKYIIMPIKQ